MAIETELKLRISPECLTRLKRHALFKTHQLTTPETHRLHNVYYDTPALELHARKMALRLRRVHGKWLQTLKGGGSVRSGLHQRLEWEVPVTSAKLDFSGLDADIWEQHLPLSLRENLQPVFVTDFYRSSRLVDWHGTIIEVCMDHGVVKTATQSTPICELELELKSGEQKHLFLLAQAILEIVPFELESVSKAEQGFRMLTGYVAKPVKGNTPEIVKSDLLSDVLQSLAWSCLMHFQANLCGTLQSCDAEYLHQMRVALRRLRVVLRMAEKIRADEELAALRELLAILGVELGRIREWDVFIAHTILPMQSLIEGQTGQQSMSGLLRASEQQRDNCYALLRSKARELQGLILRFTIWMSGDYWLKAEQEAPQTFDFVNRRLHQLHKRYQRTERQLNKLDALQLHALRIQAKKLRYSAEFFAQLFDKQQARPYLDSLSDVQELLGEINDITVALRLLDDLAIHLPEHQEVIIFIKSMIDVNLTIKFKELNKRFKVFNELRVFWK